MLRSSRNYRSRIQGAALGHPPERCRHISPPLSEGERPAPRSLGEVREGVGNGFSPRLSSVARRGMVEVLTDQCMPRTIDRPHARAHDHRLLALIHRAVRQEMREILDDPDYGLPLRASIKRRLERSQRSKRAGRVAPLEDVIARLGLKV